PRGVHSQTAAPPFRLHTESSSQTGHREWTHDRAPDEPPVGGRSSALCGWAHYASSCEDLRLVRYWFPAWLASRSSTTSDCDTSRISASDFPSGDQLNVRSLPDLKLVICRPGEPSSGCNHRLETPFSTMGYATAFPSGVNVTDPDTRASGLSTRRPFVPASRFTTFSSLRPKAVRLKNEICFPSGERPPSGAARPASRATVPGTTSGFPPSIETRRMRSATSSW